MKRGFGKADVVLAKTLAEHGAYPLTALSSDDWAYLARDLALMATMFVSTKVPGFDSHGAGFAREDSGTVAGLAFLYHEPTEENLCLVLKQQQVDESAFALDSWFVLDGYEESAVPEAALSEVCMVVGKVLNQPALAYSFAYAGAAQGALADYAWTPSHLEEKIDQQLPEGCWQQGPVLVSKHGSTAAALAFAHCLNKEAGVLFGGTPYSELAGTL